MRKARGTILLAICLSMMCADQAMAFQRKSAPVRNAEIDVNPQLPYSVEIDRESSLKGKFVTLAVNAVTTVKCPSAPLNLGFGDSAGLDYEKFYDRAPGFYLRPRRAGLLTNIVVEFEDGPIEFWVKVVEVKGGPKPGWFNSEVVIKPSLQKRESENVREELKAAKEEAEKLREKASELEKKLEEERASKSAASEIDVLVLLERTTHNFTSLPYSDIASKHLRVRQLGKAARREKGWIVVLAIENRGKTQQSIADVRAEGARVLKAGNGSRILPAGADVRLALFIESEAAPSQLTLVFADMTAAIKIEV